MSISYKDFLSKGLMITLLAFIPTHSFSAPVTLSKYSSIHYHGEFFDSIGELGGKEDAAKAKTERVIGYYNKNNEVGVYRPEYKTGFAGGIAFGYSIDHPEVFGSFRIELEGLCSQVNVKDDGYVDKDDKDHSKIQKAKQIELVRDQATSVGAAANQNWASDINNNNYRAAFKIRNEGFNNIAGMVNFYYDWPPQGNSAIAPYFGIGGGLTRIEHLKAVEYDFAYQGKVGVSYTAAPNAKFFIGYRFFNRLGDKFNKVKPLYQIPAGQYAGRMESTTATITNKFSVMGLEAGLVFNF